MLEKPKWGPNEIPYNEDGTVYFDRRYPPRIIVEKQELSNHGEYWRPLKVVNTHQVGNTIVVRVI